MNNIFIYNPQYITPLSLYNQLKSTIFLLISDQKNDNDHILNVIKLYTCAFRSDHDVSFILYLPSSPDSAKEAFLSDLEKLTEAEHFPDLLVIQEALSSEDVPRLLQVAHALIHLSALTPSTWVYSHLLMALLLEKQVISLAKSGPEFAPLNALLFHAMLDVPQTVLSSFKAIYHRNIKTNLRKQTLAFLDAIQMDLSQVLEQPVIHLDTVRMYHNTGYLKEAVGIATQLVSKQNHWWRLEEIFFIAQLFFDTGYYQRAMDMFSEILLEQPDSVPARIAMAHIHLKVGDLDAAQKTLLKAQEAAADNSEIQQQLAHIAKRLAARKRIPPILLNGLGNSASDYLSLLLAQGLDIPRVTITARVPSSYNVFVYSPTLEFAQSQGQLAKEHLSPNKLNVFMVNKLFKKILISLRDPRGTLVSWVFFGMKMTEMRQQNPEKGGFMGGKDHIFDDFDPQTQTLLTLSQDQRLDFALENGIYAEFVADIMGWLEGESAAKEMGSEYLFVVYEDFKQDEMDTIYRILDFYQIPHGVFMYPSAASDLSGSLFGSTPNVFSPNYTLRRGSPTEWMEVLSPTQIQKATAMLPEILFERFHWPQLKDLGL